MGRRKNVKPITEKEKEIAKIIYKNLDYMYCDNCRWHSELPETDPNYGCEDCHRKFNGWGLSMHSAECIAREISEKLQEKK